MSFIFSGCSTELAYYSENQVKQYVNNVFGDDYKLTDTDNTAEENPEYEYVFTNSKGEYFSIYTSAKRSVFLNTEIKY